MSFCKDLPPCKVNSGYGGRFLLNDTGHTGPPVRIFPLVKKIEGTKEDSF